MSKNKFLQFDTKAEQLICHGEWTISNLSEIKKCIEHITWSKTKKITVNGEDITKLDSAGAWFLTKYLKKLLKNVDIQYENFSDQYNKLLSFSDETKATKKISTAEHLNWVQQLEKNTLKQIKESYQIVNFIGELFFESLRTLSHPKDWRWNSICSIINKSGTSAVFIIMVLSFMIGVVITYEVGNQLRSYGADIFIVNLLGYTILREFGPLLTAIMVAARTGSASTAQLGLMKINQEIDALNTMGMTPDELLILPRIIGVFIVLPLLTVCADIFGIIGGMIMSNHTLDVTWYEFLIRFQHEIPIRSLYIGLGKTMIFAFIISIISCFQGLSVHGSAESVGTRTTRSVVLAIFLIIVTDGIFSILLSRFDL